MWSVSSFAKPSTVGPRLRSVGGPTPGMVKSSPLTTRIHQSCSAQSHKGGESLDVSVPLDQPVIGDLGRGPVKREALSASPANWSVDFFLVKDKAPRRNLIHVQLAMFQVLLSGQLTAENHARLVGLFFTRCKSPDSLDEKRICRRPFPIVVSHLEK